MRVAIICPDCPPRTGGLADHTAGLARKLADWAEVEVFTSAGGMGCGEESPQSVSQEVKVHRTVADWGFQGMRPLARALRLGQFDWVVVQYVPHMYGAKGFNFALAYVMARARSSGSSTLLMVHELYLDWSLRPRRFAAAVAQRLMLRCCVLASDRVGVSTESWLSLLNHAFRGSNGKFFYLPTPSNFEAAVSALPWAPGAVRRPRRASKLTLGFFGCLHDSKLVGHLTRTLMDMRAAGLDARLLCVGPSRSEFFKRVNGAGSDLHGWVECTGYLPEEEVVRRLSEIDIFLLPLIDGISARRSSLMAALSLGLPVVGTDGPLTDGILRGAGICRMVSAEDEASFAREALALARNPELAEALGRAGKTFYEREFSWASAGRRLQRVLRDVDG